MLLHERHLRRHGARAETRATAPEMRVAFVAGLAVQTRPLLQKKLLATAGTENVVPSNCFEQGAV